MSKNTKTVLLLSAIREMTNGFWKDGVAYCMRFGHAMSEIEDGAREVGDAFILGRVYGGEIELAAKGARTIYDLLQFASPLQEQVDNAELYDLLNHVDMVSKLLRDASGSVRLAATDAWNELAGIDTTNREEAA